MKRKGHLLPDNIGDNPTRSFCMTIPDTVEYRTAFWSKVWDFGKWFTWEHGASGDTRARDAAAEWREVLDPVYQAYLDAIDCGEGVQIVLRQNPDNPCQLQQSIDDGATWTLAFDYELCVPRGYDFQTEAALKVLTDGGSPLSPDKSYIYEDGDDPDTIALRQQALCYACYIVVEATMEIYKKTRDGDINSIHSIGAILTLISAILPIAFASIPLIIALCIALVAATLYVIASLLTTNPEFDADNVEMREGLRCALYHHLLGRPLSEANFKSAFSDYKKCAPEDFIDACIVMDTIFNSPLGGQVYAAFKEALGAVLGGMYQGAEVDCSNCVEETWCKQWTAETLLADWEFISAGTYLAGQVSVYDFYVAETYSPASQPNNQSLNMWMLNGIYVPADSTITSIRAKIIKWDGSMNASGSSFNLNDGMTSPAPIGISSVEHWYEFISAPISGRYINPQIYLSTNAGTGSGSMVISDLEIQGTGAPLFGLCNDCAEPQ